MLSSRARYATRAIVDLSRHYGERPVAIQEISQRQNIPLKYLEQILLALKITGYVQSRKGPGGGYLLSKSPDEVTLGSVVRTLDGPLAPISCVSVSGYHECGCPEPEHCALRLVFKDARDALANILDGTTFAEILRRQDAMQADPEAAALSLLEPVGHG